MPPPSTQSDAKDNGTTGGTTMDVSIGGSSPLLHSLIVIGIDVLLPGTAGETLPTVTPPLASPAFNLIGCTTVNSPATLEQCTYWKVAGSGDGSSFLFALGGTFRATSVGVNYNSTCTMDLPTGCSNPITGSSTNETVGSNFVSSGSAVSVTTNGIVAVIFGTNHTRDFIGASGTPSGTVFPATLVFEASDASHNAGTVLYDQDLVPAGSFGPTDGTLPNNDTGDNIDTTIGISTQ
jgi:hypothetical protein